MENPRRKGVAIAVKATTDNQLNVEMVERWVAEATIEFQVSEPLNFVLITKKSLLRKQSRHKCRC